MLRIISSTDIFLFAPVVENFAAQKVDIQIEYHVSRTAEIDRVLRQSPERFDVAISRAMALQIKLANDGFARELCGIDHPGWATWRSLYAFTSEPAAIVVNRAACGELRNAESGQALIRTPAQHARAVSE